MGSESFDDLVELIAKLRHPADGCPWDRGQDHRSLRPFALEEVYELIAAIDAEDPEWVAGELGDVLLQVLLHSQIASEKGEFSIRDVVRRLSEKLIRRHPHVFGEAPKDLSSIRRRWREIKSSTEKRSESAELPVLLRARKALEQPFVEDALEGVNVRSMSEEERAGFQLLRSIAAAWKAGHDPELALRKAIDALLSRSGTHTCGRE